MDVLLDPIQFFKACNPTKTLISANPEDERYYIDFAPARSSSRNPTSSIAEIFRTITRSDDPTYHLFTGHIGCGKSTELHKLESDLERHNFHVVYLDSAEDLVMNDVDMSDIILCIARQVSTSLSQSDIHLDPQGFKGLLQKTWKFLNTEIDVSGEASLPGLGTVAANTSGEATLDAGIWKLSTRLRSSPDARARLRQLLEPQTDNLIELLNEELLQPAQTALQERGKQGLVIIVDSLDRLENSQIRNQAEYIFDIRGENLRRIRAHIIYTLPLSLMFSNCIGSLSDRFGGSPKVLPMVRIQNRDSTYHEAGMNLLQHMILARAFPTIPPEQRNEHVDLVFDTPETCTRLCQVSGGHVRNLLVLLYSCLQREDPPINRDTLESIVAVQRDSLARAITPDEWDILRHVQAQQSVVGEANYQTLLRSLFVFEYRDEKGTWFGLNPILAEAQQLQ
ncbi:MAG: P-loop NTPase fold protein [Cyanobacteria bacterium P01_F01_bin.33]